MTRSLFIEERYLAGGAVSREIAYHLYARQLRGKVVIVTETPAPTLVAVRKQWVKLARRVQCERSSTLNPIHIAGMSKQLARMQSMQFIAKPQHEVLKAEVFFVEPARLLEMPPVCHTLYVTLSIDNATLTILTSHMPYGSLVVLIHK